MEIFEMQFAATWERHGCNLYTPICAGQIYESGLVVGENDVKDAGLCKPFLTISWSPSFPTSTQQHLINSASAVDQPECLLLRIL